VWAVGLDHEQKKRLLRGPLAEGEHELVIATPSGLGAVGPVGVFVRADAGHGLPPLPEDQLVVPHGDAARLLVIDCADRHHAALWVRAKGRRAAYAAAGWVPLPAWERLAVTGNQGFWPGQWLRSRTVNAPATALVRSASPANCIASKNRRIASGSG